jgi:hypothetical protein
MVGRTGDVAGGRWRRRLDRAAVTASCDVEGRRWGTRFLHRGGRGMVEEEWERMGSGSLAREWRSSKRKKSFTAAAMAWRRCWERAEQADGMGDADEGNGPVHLTHLALAPRLACQVTRTHGQRDAVAASTQRVAAACVRFAPARGVRKEARWRVRGRVRVHSGDVRASVRRNRACAARGRRCPGCALDALERDTATSATQIDFAIQFLKLQNSKKCQLTLKSPKTKVVEEL